MDLGAWSLCNEIIMEKDRDHDPKFGPQVCLFFMSCLTHQVTRALHLDMRRPAELEKDAVTPNVDGIDLLSVVLDILSSAACQPAMSEASLCWGHVLFTRNLNLTPWASMLHALSMLGDWTFPPTTLTVWSPLPGRLWLCECVA